MKCARVVGGLLALSTLLTPGVARAQIFSAYNPQTQAKKAEEPGKVRFKRLLVGTYLATWDLPTVSADTVGGIQLFDPTLPGGVRSVTGQVHLSSDNSPLVTADYFITKNLSVGGWWNPLHGEGRFQLDGSFKPLPGTTAFPPGPLLFDNNYYDFHLTYYPATKGWLGGLLDGTSVQAGYSIQNIGLDAGPKMGFQRGGDLAHYGFSNFSPNVWVNKSHRLGAPKLNKKPRAIDAFASGGYYFSGQFNKAWNLLAGASVEINNQYSLTASWWLNDIGALEQTRVSVGLTGRL